MKCIICGKELNKFQRKYCCMACAQKGYKLGLANRMVNHEKQVFDLWISFKKSFDVEKEKFTSLTAWKIRVFVSACYEMGYNPNSISRGIKKDHASILYHRKRASDVEKKLASEFLKDVKNYKYINEIEKKRIYPDGFSYKKR